MLESFITSMVTSYNFNISSCNCSANVLLLFNRVLHWMQQVNVKEILWLNQVPPMTHNKLNFLQHSRIKVLELLIHSENSAKFVPRKIICYMVFIYNTYASYIMYIHVAIHNKFYYLKLNYSIFNDIGNEVVIRTNTL